jgi:hypothetical protein
MIPSMSFFDRKRNGKTPPRTGRSKGHGRDARATKGKEGSKNMRFCETNPNFSNGFLDVTNYA